MTIPDVVATMRAGHAEPTREDALELVAGSERMVADGWTDPVEGSVRWAPAKSVWIGSMSILAIVLAPLLFTWDAFALFLITSAVTLCFGHSVGMHRKLIHGSFECPLWLERLCVYLGTLVGMAGPYGMIRLHDFRDWAQRQSACHAYSRHGAGFWRDAWWQLHCRLALQHPPRFRLEPRLANDRFYAVVERTWMLAAAPLGHRVLCARRLELAGLGHLRPGERMRHRSLADRSLRASARPTDLGGRGRVRTGL